MKITKKPKPNHPNQSTKAKSSSGSMKIFYILMLLLIASSSLIRFASARQRDPQSAETPTPESNPVSGVGTTARIFVFHHGGDGSATCTDLTVTAAGNAIYSACGKDPEKQYALSDSERSKINGWIAQFQPVNYEHTDNSQSGNVTTQLYLNGQGSQQASDADVQTLVSFAETLATKISVQP